ncbi:MAG: hypothetical protein R3E97_10865 [Candidatus Eisenbacteria bacterium]
MLFGAVLLGALITLPGVSAPTEWEVLPPLEPAEAHSPAGRPDRTGFAPTRLVFDGFGVLYALDADSDRIHRLDPDGTWVDFGVGDQGGTRFPSLRALQVRGPDLFVLDSGETVLYRMSLDGRLRARIPLVGPDLGSLDVVDFLVDKSGGLWVLDRAGSRLLQFGRNGEFLVDLAAGVAGAERLVAPTRLALGPDGGVYVLEPGARRVRRFSRQGELLGSIGYADAPAGAPVADLVVTQDALLLIDSKGRWIRRSHPDGAAPSMQAVDVGVVAGAALSPEGILYLAGAEAGRIERLRAVMPRPEPPRSEEPRPDTPELGDPHPEEPRPDEPGLDDPHPKEPRPDTPESEAPRPEGDRNDAPREGD